MAVADLDQAVASAQREGGTLRGEPGGHPEVGSWASVVDPQGAVISAFKPNYESPAPAGVFLWDELLASDVEGAKAFYRAVFGWTAEDMDMGKMGTYTLFKKGDGENAAGLMQKREAGGRAAWIPYLAADDVDATVTAAQKLGAQAFVEPMDVETVGRVAVLADPTGATFGLYKPV